MKPYLDLPGPWLVAHRGGSRLAPENTLAAFDVAARLGADAFELDVRLTREGALVVFHDEDTRRVTGAPGRVRDRSLAALKALDAGFAFTPDGGRTFPFRGRGVAVPTLREVLDAHPATRVNVEVKDVEPEAAEALVRVVREAGAVERVCLGSFDDAQGERIRALLPQACHFIPEQAGTAHVLASRCGADPASCPAGWDVADLPLRTESGIEVADATTVAWFHARGLAVFVWTVDEEADMRAVLAAGADGVMTDRPDLLARVLGR
ncbi:glycerophosphodiester phosphodiesterase [Anaeromyxobacter paludicola]|uniref:Glycerophosphoryl diester phosphodiesterase n=1 Tax=Anaeromyxobacter paludicola TaxID=2918171 RepID=A0ABN6N9R9_9BACT|nr:glycerophosphodiester phosphodiesterase [Anaeromyxobacter paludicola]BDG08707.1 glycerophosphoryl diester phosphodiesterase [Anaeromyxobacter paludicola]